MAVSQVAERPLYTASVFLLGCLTGSMVLALWMALPPLDTSGMQSWLDSEHVRLSMGVFSIVAVAAFLSGVFGLAGGSLLIGGLVLLLDVTTAQLTITAILVVTTSWRLVCWRSHAQWRAIAYMALGGVSIFAIMLAIDIVPDKAAILLVLGLPPLLVNIIPSRLWPTINRPVGQLGCGLVFGMATLLGGAGAAIVDMFFQKSRIGRLEAVATKAGLALPSVLLRGLFFCIAAYRSQGELSLSVPLWVIGGAVAVGVVSTWLGGTVLRFAVSERAFFKWNWVISICLSIFFVIEGFVLLARAQHWEMVDAIVMEAVRLVIWVFK